MPDFGLERTRYEISPTSVTKHHSLVRESFKMLFTKGNSLSLNIAELYDYFFCSWQKPESVKTPFQLECGDTTIFPQLKERGFSFPPFWSSEHPTTKLTELLWVLIAPRFVCLLC